MIADSIAKRFNLGPDRMAKLGGIEKYANDLSKRIGAPPSQMPPQSGGKPSGGPMPPQSGGKPHGGPMPPRPIKNGKRKELRKKKRLYDGVGAKDALTGSYNKRGNA